MEILLLVLGLMFFLILRVMITALPLINKKKLTQEEIKETTTKLINEKIKEAEKTIKEAEKIVVTKKEMLQKLQDELQEALNDAS